MTIFLAGRYERRDELAGYARELTEMGYTVQSRWLDAANAAFTPDEYADGLYDQNGFKDERVPAAAEAASKDINDLLNAQTLILFTEHPTTAWPRGARNVELGMALGYNLLLGALSQLMPPQALWQVGFTPKQILLVGPRENVYECLPGATRFLTWTEAREFLSQEHAESASIQVVKPQLVGADGRPLLS